MKNVFFLITLFLTSFLSFAQSQVWVDGYYRSNGTYVKGHYRTEKNHTINDNWTTRGNINPHTGKHGTRPRSVSYSYNTSRYSNFKAKSYDSPEYTSTVYSHSKQVTSSYTIPAYTAPSYTTPTYNSYNSNSSDNFLASYSSAETNTQTYASQTIYTGPRGGTYYINSNGNKTYIK
ncbi:hypothetical protein [Flavobacterium sp.]|uniref:hypothetical protein n=1 Tax=Flavobacterium sp. TaxID=239 RepID=UPI003D104C7C